VNQEDVSFYPWEQQQRKPASVSMISLLIVEDGTADTLLPEKLLRNQNGLIAEIRFATTLADASLLLAAPADSGHHFDVILLDLYLPDSEGLETYFALRRLRPELPFIILSEDEDQDIALQLVQEGVQDYLIKDDLKHTPSLLARSIRYAIERKSIIEQLKATQLQLIQAEKMESIGRLASGVAHEVKNPLAQMQLGIDYLKRHAAGVNTQIPKLLEMMTTAVERADEVICDLAEFSHDRHLEMRKCSTPSIIDGALGLVEHDLIRHHIRVERNITENLPLIFCDYVRLEQALVNILLNAIQAMDSGGTLTVEAYKGVLDEVQLDRGARAAQAMHVGDPVVTISISDTGTGILADKINLVFDPFFTTKPTGLGTGLGLTVVKKIIDLHGGKISITNRLIRGVTVLISLNARR
jgi:signal transduction histidine kinase